jgi:hypothetical protein
MHPFLLVPIPFMFRVVLFVVSYAVLCYPNRIVVIALLKLMISMILCATINLDKQVVFGKVIFAGFVGYKNSM